MADGWTPRPYVEPKKMYARGQQLGSQAVLVVAGLLSPGAIGTDNLMLMTSMQLDLLLDCYVELDVVAKGKRCKVV